VGQKHILIGLIWSQFAAYHIDRCEAVARRLGGRATVLALEVATTSVDYAWEPSGSVAGARKVTLFPGQSFDTIAPLRRFWAMLKATRNCDVVCIGLSYGEPDAILLSWALRALGRKVIVFSESKFDDRNRSAWLELGKQCLLSCYSAAIVGGRRHMAYFRFLGFRRRPVVPGYDTVGVERIRRQSGQPLAPEGQPFAARAFVFVGRFVDKKNLFGTLEGYARYVALAGTEPRRLVLIGAGGAEPALRQLAAERGVAALVDFPGFLGAEAVSRALAGGLGLVLVSVEEQWGLVVNEALALGLPVIVSDEVGARDLLVRNLVNGFVVESNCPDAMAQAMLRLGADESQWKAMVGASLDRAWLGDTDRLADAIEHILFPETLDTAARIARMNAELETERK
jgi:glycosyltransferase involved in cell wall biosynthesis